MTVRVVDGDLLDQRVEVIVNAWNRNIIPWWLLLPQGVSGAIKRRGGTAPFREVGRHGPIPLGGARSLAGGSRVRPRRYSRWAMASPWVSQRATRTASRRSTRTEACSGADVCPVDLSLLRDDRIEPEKCLVARLWPHLRDMTADHPVAAWIPARLEH